MYGVLPETTGRTRSHTNACSGRGKRRGCSAAHASGTTRPAVPGTERACAVSAIQVARWALRSLEGGKAAGGEEGVAQVLDHPLDLALLVAAVRRAGLGREVIVPGQLEQARMEADVIADPLQDDALEIVVQEGPRHPAERGEGFDVAPQETLQRLIQGEARVHGAGPREHEDEAGQDAPGAADGKRAEVSPVDLGLLAGQRRRISARWSGEIIGRPQRRGVGRGR